MPAPSGPRAAAPAGPGINRVERADGSVDALDHIASVEMGEGDVFVIETPGGGGCGAPDASPADPRDVRGPSG